MVTSGKITRADRERAWNELQTAAKEKKTRPFYRAVNKHGLMYAGIFFSRCAAKLLIGDYYLSI